jgi:tetratricopeptide (TPR) repeat protein
MTRSSDREIEAIQRKALSAAEAKRFDEALELCEGLIAVPASRIAGLRQRAGVRELQGRLTDAISDLKAVLLETDDEPADHHALGLIQLEIGQTRDAVQSFTRCLELGGTSGFNYYSNSCLFFRAIAHMKINELESALSDCSQLPPGYSTHVIGEGMMSREEILDQIKRRRGNR